MKRFTLNNYRQELIAGCPVQIDGVLILPRQSDFSYEQILELLQGSRRCIIISDRRTLYDPIICTVPSIAEALQQVGVQDVWSEITESVHAKESFVVGDLFVYSFTNEVKEIPPGTKKVLTYSSCLLFQMGIDRIIKCIQEKA